MYSFFPWDFCLVLSKWKVCSTHVFGTFFLILIYVCIDILIAVAVVNKVVCSTTYSSSGFWTHVFS